MLLVVASCGSAPATAPRPGTPAVSHTSPAAPAATASPAPEGVNLVVTTEVRRALEQAYASYVATNIPFTVGYVAGEAPGVYYGYHAPTATYWALATFTPSQAAVDRSQQLPSGSGLDPLIFFQDGPFIFSRPAGGRWHFVTDTGGTICSPPVPDKLLYASSIPPPANRSCRDLG